jgi:hypothetical protein
MHLVPPVTRRVRADRAGFRDGLARGLCAPDRSGFPVDKARTMGVPSEFSGDSREPMDSPWTEVAGRPTPYDDFTVSQETGRITQGTLRRFPRWGWLILVLLFVIPMLSLILSFVRL